MVKSNKMWFPEELMLKIALTGHDQNYFIATL